MSARRSSRIAATERTNPDILDVRRSDVHTAERKILGDFALSDFLFGRCIGEDDIPIEMDLTEPHGQETGKRIAVVILRETRS